MRTTRFWNNLHKIWQSQDEEITFSEIRRDNQVTTIQRLHEWNVGHKTPNEEKQNKRTLKRWNYAYILMTFVLYVSVELRYNTLPKSVRLVFVDIWVGVEMTVIRQ